IGPDSDRQWFEQRGRVVADFVGHLVSQIGLHSHEFRQRAVDRRRAMESHVWAKVVSAGPTLIAATAGPTRLDRDAIADSRPCDSFADLDYLTGRFVSEGQRTADNEIADAPVLVILE